MKYSQKEVKDVKSILKSNHQESQSYLKGLQKEIDIHFILNSLTTLNHLILTDQHKAHLYSVKLAQVYKYFLVVNKQPLVLLKTELEFINDYFYLLQLRYGNKLQLEIICDDESRNSVLVPPCSLQLLIENAVKHNECSNENPLLIAIVMNEKYLKVINHIRPKPRAVNSTHVGLGNLSARYKLTCNKDIQIECDKGMFIVNLPIIRSYKIVPLN